MYAVFSAIIATGFAILLGQWLSSGNLVLIYVLAVMIVGLRHGAGPAMTTVAIAILSFDFFLAEPIFGFFPTQQDDIAAMVFLVVIALLCGVLVGVAVGLAFARRAVRRARDGAAVGRVRDAPARLWGLSARRFAQGRAPRRALLMLMGVNHPSRGWRQS